MMPYTIATPCEWVEEIKKSRFVSRAFPLALAEDAEAILKKIRTETATHHCYAYKYGQNYRFSDDGEPSGTAGKPILTAIEGRDCDRILIVVTRYYGGIQLGTGGLARAYGGGASRCLQQAELVELIDMAISSFTCSFHEFSLIESRLENYKAFIENKEFEETGVRLTLKLPSENQPHLAAWLKDISRGRIDIE